MDLAYPPPPKPALARGAPLALGPNLPTDLQAAIAHRVAQSPRGVVRTYRPDGSGRVATYAELWQRAGGIAAALQQRGAGGRVPVILLIEDATDFVPAVWACLRAGATAVPLMSAARAAYHGDRAAPLREALDRLDRAVVLADEAFADVAALMARGRDFTVVSQSRAEAEPAARREDRPAADPVCLVPTSGSTGDLKLVAVSPQAMLNRIFALPRHQDHWLGTLALDSVTAQNGVFLRFGSWTQMPAQVLTSNPTAALDAIALHRITSVGMTNSAVRQMIAAAAATDRRFDLSSLQQFGLGAEPIVPKVVESLADFLRAHGASADIIRCGYGTTETGLLTGGGDPRASLDRRREAVPLGHCAPGVALRVVGDDGAVLPEGELGELEAHCPATIFSGYWREPDLTAQGFTNDGWWRTGDLGRLHNGELSLHGRAKEILIVSGRKYSLAAIDTEIEAALAIGDRAYSCAIHWPGEASERLAIAFVPAERGAAYRTALADRIDRVVARRFGFRPRPVIAATLADIPFAANGKLRRQELSARVRAGAFDDSEPVEARPRVAASPSPRRPLPDLATLRARLAEIWRDALNIDGALDPDANFFDLGGDSLRSLTLHTAIEEEFGHAVSAEAFFANPTFANLFSLVAAGGAAVAPGDGAAATGVPWPFPAPLRNKLLHAFATWSGSRPSRDKLVAGLNTAAEATPLFWVCQDRHTFRQLADALGPGRPVYAFRSGEGLISYTEDEIQTFALRYVSEIEEVCPQGPVFVGGNCQGAVIALAMAQHLLRRGRHVPLLVLFDWGFPLQPYPGPVLLMHGRDSASDNPYRLFLGPDAARARAWPQHIVVEMPADHGVYYEQAFRDVLPRHLREAEATAPWVLPREARRAVLVCNEVPDRMTVGERRTLTVTLRNMSAIPWPAADKSGLALGSRWLDAAGNVVVARDGRVPLPDVPAHAAITLSLPITAPLQPGGMKLLIDVVEEGSGWFQLPQDTSWRGRVWVFGESEGRSTSELMQELHAARELLAQEARAARELVASYENSTSWKVTRPLRALKRLGARWRGLVARRSPLRGE